MIELIVIDVDGTLTDGKIYYSSNLEEIKAFNIKDGLMIKSWNRLGKKSAIITGRKSSIVERRAKELDISYLYQGVENKVEVLDKIVKDLNIDYSKVAVIGDDMNDLGILKKASFSFAPIDANQYIYSIVTNPLTKKGGRGAVAEMIEIILKQNNIYNDFIALWDK